MKNFRHIEFLQCFVFLILTVLFNECSSAGFNAEPENRFIDTEINKTDNLLCKAGNEKIRFCWWTHSDFGLPNNPLNFFEIMKDNPTGNVDFLYYGKGMENGECGIQIPKMEKKYLGFWNCSLVSESNNVYVASIQVRLSEKSIRKPTLERSALEKLLVDNKTGVVPSRNITCCSCACEPRSKLEFLLDHVPILESDNIITTTENDGTICLTWHDAYLKGENNGKVLQCLLYPRNASDELLTDSLHLNIKYAPILYEREGSFILDVSCDAESVNISIGFSGNPLPDIGWQMKKIGESDMFSTVLDNGKKYNVQRHFLGDDRYVAELIIRDFEKHDLDYEYILKVTNEYGSKIITIRLKRNYIDCYNLLLIIGAILFAVFAIVTIGLVVWAFKTRRFCCQKTTTYPITPKNRTSRPGQKHPEVTYKKASSVDTTPDSAEENDTSANTNTRSSIVTEIQ